MIGIAGWITIGILIVVIFLAWTVMKARHFKSRVWAVFLIILLLFVYISLSNIIKTSGIDIKSFEGVVKVTKLYFVWLGHAFENSKVIVGNAVKMNWGANSTS